MESNNTIEKSFSNEQDKVGFNQSVITEKNYPITRIWIFKSPIVSFVLALAFAFIPGFTFYTFGLIIVVVVGLIFNPFIRANFHYAVESQYFNAKQGIIAKKEKHTPYGVIQNLLVKQDIFDRIFGIASLIIENASEGGGRRQAMQKNQGQADFLGFSGNKMSIPGLKKADAEALKLIILQKIKDNPIADTQSGL